MAISADNVLMWFLCRQRVTRMETLFGRAVHSPRLQWVQISTECASLRNRHSVGNQIIHQVTSARKLHGDSGNVSAQPPPLLRCSVWMWSPRWLVGLRHSQTAVRLDYVMEEVGFTCRRHILVKKVSEMKLLYSDIITVLLSV